MLCWDNLSNTSGIKKAILQVVVGTVHHKTYLKFLHWLQNSWNYPMVITRDKLVLGLHFLSIKIISESVLSQYNNQATKRKNQTANLYALANTLTFRSRNSIYISNISQKEATPCKKKSIYRTLSTEILLFCKDNLPVILRTSCKISSQ